jgi:hypothetical protein
VRWFKLQTEREAFCSTVKDTETCLHVGSRKTFFWDVSISDINNRCLWDVVPCCFTQNRRFGGTYRPHLQGIETLEFSMVVARIRLTADGEESLLQRHPHSRVYPLPWSADWPLLRRIRCLYNPADVLSNRRWLLQSEETCHSPPPNADQECIHTVNGSGCVLFQSLSGH